MIDQIAQQTGDRTAIAALSGESTSSYNPTNGITVFVPINEALINIPNNLEHFRNEILNLIARGL